MPSNRDILNLGQPAIPDPPELTDDGSRYGNALSGFWGFAAAPTSYGDYVRRIPTLFTAQAVSFNAHTTAGAGIVSASGF